MAVATEFLGSRDGHSSAERQAERVSVVIPTHNRADLIGQAIESVLAQTARPGEVIVVDDRSDDGTAKVLDAFGDAIQVIRTSTNVERGSARNLGARAAAGELLAFLDSDDAWEPGKLRAQVTAHKHPSVTGLRFVDVRGVPVGTYLPPARNTQMLTIENHCLGAPSSLLLPRVAFDEVGGFPRPVTIRAPRTGCSW